MNKGAEIVCLRKYSAWLLAYTHVVSGKLLELAFIKLNRKYCCVYCTHGTEVCL